MYDTITYSVTPSELYLYFMVLFKEFCCRWVGKACELAFLYLISKVPIPVICT